MSNGHKESAPAVVKNDEIVFSPRVLDELVKSINMKLEIKQQQCKVDTVTVAMNRLTTVPVDIEYPRMDLQRDVDVLLKRPVNPLPQFFLASEVANRRKILSAQVAESLASCSRASKSYTPMTSATSAMISKFLGTVDETMNRFSARRANALVDIATDEHQTQQHVHNLFRSFLDGIKDDESVLLLTDTAYSAIVDDCASSYSVNRSSPVGVVPKRQRLDPSNAKSTSTRPSEYARSARVCVISETQHKDSSDTQGTARTSSLQISRSQSVSGILKERSANLPGVANNFGSSSKAKRSNRNSSNKENSQNTTDLPAFKSGLALLAERNPSLINEMAADVFQDSSTATLKSILSRANER